MLRTRTAWYGSIGLLTSVLQNCRSEGRRIHFSQNPNMLFSHRLPSEPDLFNSMNTHVASNLFLFAVATPEFTASHGRKQLNSQEEMS